MSHLNHLWGQYGGNDVTKLEALVVLHSQSLPINDPNLQAMMQLLAGGPLSHLLARLTMAIKAEQNAKLTALGKRLTAFWQLGHLDKNMIQQIGEFQKLVGGISEELAKLDSKGLSPDTETELRRLGNLFDAHKLLAESDEPGDLLALLCLAQSTAHAGRAARAERRRRR